MEQKDKLWKWARWKPKMWRFGRFEGGAKIRKRNHRPNVGKIPEKSQGSGINQLTPASD